MSKTSLWVQVLLTACVCLQCCYGDWQKHSILHPPTLEAGLFGWGGALSEDSKTLLVIGFRSDYYNNNTRYQNITSNLWVYQLNNQYRWDLPQQLDYNLTEQPTSSFGSATISSTGKTIVAIHSKTGSLYIWTKGGGPKGKFSFTTRLPSNLTFLTQDGHRVDILRDERIVVGCAYSNFTIGCVQMTEFKSSKWQPLVRLEVNSTGSTGSTQVAMNKQFIFSAVNGAKSYLTTYMFDKTWNVQQHMALPTYVISLYADDTRLLLGFLPPYGVHLYRLDPKTNNFTLTYIFQDSENKSTTEGIFGLDVSLVDDLAVITLWDIPGWMYLFDTTQLKILPRVFQGPVWNETSCAGVPGLELCFLKQGYGSRVSGSKFLIASFAGPDRAYYNDTQYFSTDDDPLRGQFPTNNPIGTVSVYIDRCRIPGVKCVASVNTNSSAPISMPQNTTVLIIDSPVTLTNASLLLMQQGQIINSTECFQFAGTFTYITNSSDIGSIAGQNTSVVDVINFENCPSNETTLSQFSTITVQDENSCSYPSEGVYTDVSFSLLISPVSSGGCLDQNSNNVGRETSGNVRTVLLAVLIPVLVCVGIVIVVVLVGGLIIAIVKKKAHSTIGGDTDL